MYNNDKTGDKCPKCESYETQIRFEYINEVLDHLKVKCMKCKNVWNKEIIIKK